jgi:signal transduction histidine kinase
VTVRARTLTLAVAAASAAATLLIELSPLSFAYRGPLVKVALETAAALIALLAAYLVLGRLRRSARLDHLVLTCALGILAASNLAFAALPQAFGAQNRAFWSWAATGGYLLGAIALAAAAFAPARLLARPKQATVGFLAASAVGLVAFSLSLAAVMSGLPVRERQGLAPQSSERTSLVAEPTVLVLFVVAMVAFALAAAGFTIRAERRRDDLLRWFAVGAVLATFSRLNFVLYPSLFTRWVYTGDVFRLLFYLVLLFAAVRELERYWRRFAEAAVLEERRRIARDLHDGLAQELAGIVRGASSGRRDNPTLARIAASAERALSESRRVIAALTRPLDEPLDVVLAQAVEETADRTETRLELDLERGIEVAPATREALVRIACEAVSNAGRHAQAHLVRVELSKRGRLTLRVVDDGVGFDPERVEPRADGGFGLTSMAERARALGAELRVASVVGEGTQVEVVLP